MATPRTAREYVLLGVLAVVLSGAYFLGRYRPAQAELSELAASTAESISKRDAIKIPPPPIHNAIELNKELALVKESAETEQARLDDLQRQFAPTATDLQQLNVEIASLAQRCGVKTKQRATYDIARLGLPGGDSSRRVVTTVRPENTPPIPPPKPAAAKPGEKPAASKSAAPEKKPEPPAIVGPFIDLPALEQVTGRQPERLVIEGSFNGLRQFLQGLDRLRWRVTVVWLEVEMMQRTDGFDRTPALRSTLILGL